MKINQARALVILLISIIMVICLAAGCDDDDDDDGSDDDDDVSDDDMADDDDDTTWTGPDCPAFAEGDRWFEIPNMNQMSGEFNDEKDDDGIVTAEVSIDGDDFTIEKGTYKLEGQWLRSDSGMPFSDGQSVKVYHTESAGDDGCCDTEGLHVWDESFGLLLVYKWNEGLNNLKFGDTEINQSSDFTNGCEYLEGQRPDDTDKDWLYINGLSLVGSYEGSDFLLDIPGTSGMTDDQQFEINYPVGYQGEAEHDDDETYWTHRSIFEIVTVAIPE